MKNWKASIQSEHSSIPLASLNSVIIDKKKKKMGERAQCSRGTAEMPIVLCRAALRQQQGHKARKE